MGGRYSSEESNGKLGTCVTSRFEKIRYLCKSRTERNESGKSGLRNRPSKLTVFSFFPQSSECMMTLRFHLLIDLPLAFSALLSSVCLCFW